MERESFISNLIGHGLYDELKSYAGLIVGIGTTLLVVLFPLSHVCYWTILRKLFSLCTGYAIPFLIYVVAFIVLLDIQVDAQKSDKWSYDLRGEKEKKSPTYKYTVIWGTLLIVVGIMAVYYTNKVSRHYAFQCTEYFVEKEVGIYHLYEDCEYAKDKRKLVKMKGYEFEKLGYQICEPCAEYAEDIEGSSEDIYYRR
jgi:hypothetical protein